MSNSLRRGGSLDERPFDWSEDVFGPASSVEWFGKDAADWLIVSDKGSDWTTRFSGLLFPVSLSTGPSLVGVQSLSNPSGRKAACNWLSWLSGSLVVGEGAGLALGLEPDWSRGFWLPRPPDLALPFPPFPFLFLLGALNPPVFPSFPLGPTLSPVFFSFCSAENVSFGSEPVTEPAGERGVPPSSVGSPVGPLEDFMLEPFLVLGPAWTNVHSDVAPLPGMSANDDLALSTLPGVSDVGVASLSQLNGLSVSSKTESEWEP